VTLEAEVLVVGGGMAGAVAALAARAAGARAILVRRSPGATALSSGAVSVAPDLGALPGVEWCRRGCGRSESGRKRQAGHSERRKGARPG